MQNPTLDLLWAIASAVIFFVVWLVRLEAKVNNMREINMDVKSDCKLCKSEFESKLSTLSMKHDSLELKVVEQLSQVKESLARIEGFLTLKEREK